MKRIVTIILIAFILIGLAVPATGCSPESSETEAAEDQVVTVQRGDLTIEITAAGNLALSSTEDLTFDLFYQEGTVEEVLVEEGDTVEEGEVLASLDIEEWDEQLRALEDKVTAARRQLTTEERDLLQAEINLQTAEDNLKNAQEDMEATDALELAIYNAEISVRNKEHTVGETQDIYTWPEIEVAQIELDNAKTYYEYVQEEGLSSAVITYAKSRVTAAEATLNALINSYDTEEVAIAKMELEAARMSLAKAQKDLDDYLGEAAEDLAITEISLELAQYRLEDARIAVEDALEDLIDAQADFDEAESKNPVIAAPFSGFITMVNVEGGDGILRGTVAMQIADPEKFEADIMVSEMDILQVKLGGEAWVQVDAMSGLTLPATVTHISPTATIQSGVVNYKVKVEVQSLEAAAQERQAARQGAMQGIQQGEIPERLQQAIDEGRITREQAEEMMKQTQQAPVPASIPEDFQLREGLTVTVTIMVEGVNDVLLVPNPAITHQGGQSYVKVVSADGTTEERAIQTGISDWQYTEVTEGLSEGEQVVVPQGTTTPATSQQRGMFIPGMGRSK